MNNLFNELLEVEATLDYLEKATLHDNELELKKVHYLFSGLRKKVSHLVADVSEEL